MDEAEVVVVGAGAGGLAAAWRFTTRGVRVVLLEAGREYVPDADYPQDWPDFERRSFPYDWIHDEAGKPRYGFGEAQPVGPEWNPYRSFNHGQGLFAPGESRRYVQYAHVRGVGGSTLAFQGEAHRLHPHALRMRELFGHGADWPLEYAELERYYDIVEQLIGVAGPGENPWRPRSRPPVLPAHRLSYASQRLRGAFAEAGATLIPNHLAILSRWWDRRPPCNYCNACSAGCPMGDKGSSDVTFYPHAAATGLLDLRKRCQAVALDVDRHGRPVGVIYADQHGARHLVRARVIVLACGAIETARLLLLSRSRHHPNGIGNEHGQVGRNLTELLFWQSVGLLPERVDSFRGLPIDATAWDFAVPHEGDGWVGGFRLATSHGAANLRGPAAYAERLVSGFGTEHRRRVSEVFGRGVAVLAVGEWFPNRRTMVDLDPLRQDEHSLPVARIASWLGEGERNLLRSMAQTVRAILRTVGARVAEETSALDLFSASHTLGTCRMGCDVETSVADPEGICHGIPNLAFADGSLLPSSGTGDSPFLTIAALAVRTADKLLDRRSGA